MVTIINFCELLYFTEKKMSKRSLIELVRAKKKYGKKLSFDYVYLHGEIYLFLVDISIKLYYILV